MPPLVSDPAPQATPGLSDGASGVLLPAEHGRRCLDSFQRVALIDLCRFIIRYFGGYCVCARLSRMSFHGCRVPGMRCLQMLSVGESPKLFRLASTDADAWLGLTNGSPLPRIVTLISLGSSGSVPGLKMELYFRLGVPTTGVVVSGRVPPSYASFVDALISAFTPCP